MFETKLLRGRGQAHPAACISLLLAMLLLPLSGCADLRGDGSWRSAPAAYAPPSPVAVHTTFAEGSNITDGTLSPEDELLYLDRMDSTPAAIRRAWLLMRLGRMQAALDSTAQVLYAPTRPSAHDESFARYLRAEVLHRTGRPEHAAYDRERARELALDPTLQRLLAQPSSTTRRTTSAWGSLAVQPRTSWSQLAADPSNLSKMQQPTRVTIHHSAVYFRGTNANAAATQIARIQHEHMRGRGYGDIGYHFLIDPSGRIWEGRKLQWQGAHASGSNNVGNVGICLLGNFVRDGGGQKPTPGQIDAMQDLVEGLMDRYRLAGDALFCHSDFKATACPGPRMRPIVRQLARLLGGNKLLGGRGSAAVAAYPDEE
ncbi:MAG: peptidoglycan recognition family protein [Planctomycetota bacterium]